MNKFARKILHFIIKDLKKCNGKFLGLTLFASINFFIFCWISHIIYFNHWSSKTTSYSFSKGENTNIFEIDIFPSQKNLDLALKYSKIKLPASCQYPKFIEDYDLENIYAEVKQKSIYQKREVFFYPNAFRSWSTLLSTLSHEIEIHCRQDFMSYYLVSDLLGLSDQQREALIEIPAYQHEIKQAVRFQNTNNLDSIKENIAFFYIHLGDTHIYD